MDVINPPHFVYIYKKSQNIIIVQWSKINTGHQGFFWVLIALPASVVLQHHLRGQVGNRKLPVWFKKQAVAGNTGLLMVNNATEMACTKPHEQNMKQLWLCDSRPALTLKFSSVSSCPRQILGVTESQSEEGLSALGKNASGMSISEESYVTCTGHNLKWCLVVLSNLEGWLETVLVLRESQF